MVSEKLSSLKQPCGNCGGKGQWQWEGRWFVCWCTDWMRRV